MHTKYSPCWCGCAAVLLSALVSLWSVPSARGDNPPWPPLVSVLPLDSDAAEEGTDPATFLVVRIGPANTALTINYTLGGEAVNGVDYQLLSGTVTIPEGAYFAPVSITPIDDYEVEGSESVILALQQPLVWPPPYIVTWPSVALAEIADNDRAPTNQPPWVTLTHPPDGGIFEAGDDIALVARAFDKDGRVLTVEFFDGTNSVGRVTNQPPFAAATTDLSLNLGADPTFALDAQTFLDADVKLDAIPRGQRFQMIWSNAPPGVHVLTALAMDNDGATTRSAPVTIKVSELPPVPVVSIRAADPIATEPDPTSNHLDTASFVVYRKGPTNSALLVFYEIGGTASNGVDYLALPPTVLIPAGERAAKVIVEPLDDLLVEGPETVVLTLVPSPILDPGSPLPEAYRIGRANTARAVIRDNDAPANQPPLVRLIQPQDGDIFLALSDIRLSALARDFDGFVTQVEFFEGTNSLGIITNHPSPASVARPAYSMIWSNVPPGGYVLTAVATDNDGATTDSKPVEIKVVPLVEPPVVNLTAIDPVASEPGVPAVVDPAVFAVTRTGPTNAPLSVFYSIQGTALNGIDYQLIPGRLLIPPGSSSNVITIQPIHDLLVEGTETVVLQLEPPPVLAPDRAVSWWYRIGSNDVAKAVILDANTAPSNQPPSVTLVSPPDDGVFVAPADITLAARAHDLDGWVRTVEFFEGTNRLGIVTNPPSSVGGPVNPLPEQLFLLKWPDVPPGAYALTALAIDNLGAATRSLPVHIKVVPPRAPVVTIYATDPYASEGNWIGPVPAPVPLSPNQPALFPDRPHTATFTVFRGGNTNDDLLVQYQLGGTASNGVDYAKLSGEVKIPAGQTQASIVVDPIDDNLVEPTETVVAKLMPLVCIATFPPPPGCYRVGDPDAAQALIFDNDRNQSPKVEIAHPADGDVFRAATDLEIDVVTRDPDGYVPLVEFFANGTKIGEQRIFFIVAPPPGQPQKFSMIWSNVPAGKFVLTARATDELGAASLSDPVVIRVLPDAGLPVVNIVAVDPVATEPNPLVASLPDPARFRISRDGGDLTQALKVQYRISGTASNGLDYVALPGVATIPAGSNSVPVDLIPLDDNLVEGTEWAILSLVPPPCLTSNVASADCYLVGQPGRAIAYIRDNDAPSNRPPNVTIVSPANGATYCAPLDLRLIAAAQDPDGWVTTVEFFDGTNRLGTASNLITVLDATLDRVPEVGPGIISANTWLQPFSLTWSNVPPGPHVLTAVATDNTGSSTRSRPVPITVREMQAVPLVSLMTVDAIAREATTNTAAFRVHRTGPTNASLTVYYAIHGSASNGVDYETLSGVVTIPAGRRNARIVVTPIDDTLPERVETVILRLTPPPVGPDTYELGHPRIAAAVILDNDCALPGFASLPDGSVQLHLEAQVAMPLRVESSTDLANWEVESTFTSQADAVSFIDAERSDYAVRFFRIVPEYGEIDDDSE